MQNSEDLPEINKQVLEDSKEPYLVFVSNIPYDATPDEIKQHFKKYGPVLSFKFLPDKSSGRLRGSGFVEFTNQDDCDQAISDAPKVTFKGRTLRANIKYSQNSRPASTDVGPGSGRIDRFPPDSREYRDSRDRGDFPRSEFDSPYDYPDRNRNDRFDRNDRIDRNDRNDRPDRNDRIERNDRPFNTRPDPPKDFRPDRDDYDSHYSNYSPHPSNPRDDDRRFARNYGVPPAQHDYSDGPSADELSDLLNKPFQQLSQFSENQRIHALDFLQQKILPKIYDTIDFLSKQNSRLPEYPRNPDYPRSPAHDNRGDRPYADNRNNFSRRPY